MAACTASTITSAVVGDKAATFLHGTLVPHDQAIKHAAIRMYTESDQIEWDCDQAFEIASLGARDYEVLIVGRDSTDRASESPPVRFMSENL